MSGEGVSESVREFEARQIRAFEKMALDGLIFQGLKPIYWSPFNETAVADSEIVYRDVTDATIYLAFQVADGKGILAAVGDDDSPSVGSEADCRRLTIFERFCRLKIAFAAWSFGVLEI